MATAKVIDMTNVKDGGNFNKRRMPAGDYPARITKVEDAKSKADDQFQWLFTIAVDNGGTYPYYCKLQENQLWKIRNLCIAAGMNVPKKKLKLDPEKLVGKRIAVTLEDDEYEGKAQSVVQATFPLSELDDYAGDDDDAVGDDADDEDEEEEVQPPPKKKAKSKPAPEPEEDEEDEEEEVEDEEDEEEDELAGLNRDQLKRRLRKASPGVKISRKQTDDDLRDAIRAAEGGEEEEDDEEDEEEAAPPPKKKAGKKRSTKVEDVTDDELDELDIDEI
jgi:nucleolin